MTHAGLHVHDVQRIKASATYTTGSPLKILVIDKDGGEVSFTVYLGNAAFATEIVNAINAVCEKHGRKA